MSGPPPAGTGLGVYCDASWQTGGHYGIGIVVWHERTVREILLQRGVAVGRRGYETDAIELAIAYLGDRKGRVYNDCRPACQRLGATFISRKLNTWADRWARAARLYETAYIAKYADIVTWL